MKSLFILINFFLLGFLVLLVFLNSSYGFDLDFALLMCAYAVPLVLAILYAKGSVVNIYVKWLLFGGYVFAAFSMIVLGVTEGSAYWWDLSLLVMVVVSLFFSAYYMFNSKTAEYEKKTQDQETKLYKLISDELKSGNTDDATWTKAIAKSNGNEEKVKSLYVKLRYDQLKKQDSLGTKH